MALPSSGTLKLKGTSGSGTSIADEVDGSTAGVKRLSTLGFKTEKDGGGGTSMKEFYSYTGPGFDDDAVTFLQTAGITDSTQKNAIADLVAGLKTDGIWTKIYCLYPFVGGTATTHKYNLIDPTTFTITWYGGWTHNSTGVHPNGTTAYGDTGFVPSTDFTTSNDYTIGVYNRSNGNASGTKYVLSSCISSPYCYISLRIKIADGTTSCLLDGDTNPSYRGGQTSTSTMTGLITAVQNGTLCAVYRNSSGVASNDYTGGNNDRPDASIYISSHTIDGTAQDYSSKSLSAVLIGDYLDATEIGYLSDRIGTYQSDLSRGGL